MPALSYPCWPHPVVERNRQFLEPMMWEGCGRCSPKFRVATARTNNVLLRRTRQVTQGVSLQAATTFSVVYRPCLRSARQRRALPPQVRRQRTPLDWVRLHPLHPQVRAKVLAMGHHYQKRRQKPHRQRRCSMMIMTVVVPRWQLMLLRLPKTGRSQLEKDFSMTTTTIYLLSRCRSQRPRQCQSPPRNPLQSRHRFSTNSSPEPRPLPKWQHQLRRVLQVPVRYLVTMRMRLRRGRRRPRRRPPSPRCRRPRAPRCSAATTTTAAGPALRPRPRCRPRLPRLSRRVATRSSMMMGHLHRRRRRLLSQEVFSTTTMRCPSTYQHPERAQPRHRNQMHCSTTIRCHLQTPPKPQPLLRLLSPRLLPLSSPLPPRTHGVEGAAALHHRPSQHRQNLHHQ
mmetsp:Transcript_177178/g.568170  ORF Transcript_177178/g.568170 Transcript_177178/m.568170 type:complete len:397 (+) Transcript_177178:588-1778(+)